MPYLTRMVLIAGAMALATMGRAAGRGRRRSVTVLGAAQT